MKSDTSLAILPADKGNCTVGLHTTQYDSKILSMLSDKDTYEKLPKDPTAVLECRMNAMLLNLRRSGHLSEAQYNRLRSSAGHIPLICGLPKIHKADVRLRPIVSFVSSPTYQLSKHLCYLRRPLQGHTESTIPNSKQFSTFIATQEIAHEKSLASFDFVLLFTRIHQTDPWHSDGLPSISKCSQPSHGGCQTESLSDLSQPTQVLEALRRWHLPCPCHIWYDWF